MLYWENVSPLSALLTRLAARVPSSGFGFGIFIMTMLGAYVFKHIPNRIFRYIVYAYICISDVIDAVNGIGVEPQNGAALAQGVILIECHKLAA